MSKTRSRQTAIFLAHDFFRLVKSRFFVFLPVVFSFKDEVKEMKRNLRRTCRGGEGGRGV